MDIAMNAKTRIANFTTHTTILKMVAHNLIFFCLLVLSGDVILFK
jgi:hypothetical protein